MNVAQVRRHALSLPEATEEPHFDYTSFRIRGKIFATVPPEGEHVHIFVADEERDAALEAHPGFIEKLMWGASVVGLRVFLADAELEAVTKLLTQAWLRKAPKRLATAFQNTAAGAQGLKRSGTRSDQRTRRK